YPQNGIGGVGYFNHAGETQRTSDRLQWRHAESHELLEIGSRRLCQPRSELARNQPEWAAEFLGRDPNRWRFQYQSDSRCLQRSTTFGRRDSGNQYPNFEFQRGVWSGWRSDHEYDAQVRNQSDSWHRERISAKEVR